MLVTPTFIDKGDQDRMAILLESITSGASREPETLGEGYALIAHWNPAFCIAEIAAAEVRGRDDFEFAYPKVQMPDGEYIPRYGVCDSVEQFDALYGDTLRAHEHSFIVTFVEVLREDQPSWGGWRYHKWGEYVGTQEPQSEYLYHDKHIDRVFTFSLNRVA